MTAWWQVFRWPIAIAVATLAGLVLALAGDHVAWKIAAWGALGAPIVIVARALRRAQRSNTSLA